MVCTEHFIRPFFKQLNQVYAARKFRSWQTQTRTHIYKHTFKLTRNRAHIRVHNCSTRFDCGDYSIHIQWHSCMLFCWQSIDSNLFGSERKWKKRKLNVSNIFAMSAYFGFIWSKLMWRTARFGKHVWKQFDIKPGVSILWKSNWCLYFFSNFSFWLILCLCRTVVADSRLTRIEREIPISELCSSWRTIQRHSKRKQHNTIWLTVLKHSCVLHYLWTEKWPNLSLSRVVLLVLNCLCCLFGFGLNEIHFIHHVNE